MASLRQDPLTGRWVILAAGRSERPDDYADLRRRAPALSREMDPCPFCPGQEHETPKEVLATGRPDGAPPNSPGWRVRAFPNKFPALRLDTDPLLTVDALCPEQAAVGGHEVVVCGPEHTAGLGDMSVGLLVEILEVVQQRVKTLGMAHPAVRHVLVFGNQGPDAGATLVHPHWQIIAMSVEPMVVKEKAAGFAAYRQENGTCLLCDLVTREEADGSRLIAANEHWVVIAPWASRYSHEMRFIPRRHAADLTCATPAELQSLAGLLKPCVGRLQKIIPHVSFNLVVHGAAREMMPHRAESAGPDNFHWHLEILPRLSRQAGFEAGSGFAINSTPPEEAALRLRGSRGEKRNTP